MGRKLVLSGTKITNTSAPFLPDVDAILPSAGALVFIDPTHPYRSWDSGLAVHQSLLPNLAEDQAIAATGLTAANVSPQLFIGSKMQGNGNKLERSTLGGLHAIFSQAAYTTENAGMFELGYYESRPDRTFQEWWMANKAHSFYAAKWGRWTRGMGAGTSNWQHSRIAQSNQAISFYARNTSSGETVYPTDATRVGWSALNTTPATAAPYFLDGAVSDASGATGATFQPAYGTRTSAADTEAPSDLVYGYYLEDLTISGRTYAEVNSLVRAKFDRDVLTEGGRYYGDTYTDPATIV